MSTAVENTSKSAQLRIDITGQPGSGGSTLAANIEKVVGSDRLKKISGGVVRRAMAYLWDEYSKQSPIDNLTEVSQEIVAKQWQKFERSCKETYEADGFPGFLKLLEKHWNRNPDTKILNAFNTAHEQYGREPFFDLIIDEYQLRTTEAATGNYILESKLAVLLRHIQELQHCLDTERVFSLPLINVYLTVDPTISAQRITQRERTPILEHEVMQRRQADWLRYGSFYHTISGQPITEADALNNSFVIDTSQLTEEEVLTETLLYILIQLIQTETELGYEQVSNSWQQLLTELLQQSRILTT